MTDEFGILKPAPACEVAFNTSVRAIELRCDVAEPRTAKAKDQPPAYARVMQHAVVHVALYKLVAKRGSTLLGIREP